MTQKNDYISDNLITIRDRLRESASAMRETPVRAPAASPAPAPEAAVSRRQEEGERAKLDLSGRLAHDLAEIEGDLEKLSKRSEALQQLQKNLVSLQEKLQAATPAALQNGFAAETDRLRMEYFRLRGTFDAWLRKTEDPVRGGTFQPAGDSLADAWIIAGAIVLGAAMVAGVTAAIFH